ncbi:MAG: hypothetical protein ACR2N4_06110 [Jatrophihabitans sp.]
MTAALFSETGQTSVPDFARLVRIEFQRFFARRFIWIAGALALLGLFVAVGASYAKHSRISADDLAAATRQRDQVIAEISQQVQDCSKGLAVEQAQQQCGQVPTAQDFPPDQFLRSRPFEPRQVSDYALAIGVAVALIGFAVGATFIGAEWSTKNLVSWLFWEPRRLRLMAAKLLALLSVALAVAVLAQLAWFAAAHLLLHYRGLPVSSLGAQSKHFWQHVRDSQLRAVLLVLPTSLLGFGMANLIRNTAAAFGVGFVYFAVVESLIRTINPDWQPYLLTTNVGAWVSNGGLTVFGKAVFDQRQGYVTARPIHVSNLHGGIALLIYSGVVLLVSVIVFRRRDIS